MPTDLQVEAAAKVIAHWIGYAWEGLGERDISDKYPDWIWGGGAGGGTKMQGGKPALRRVACKALQAAEAAARVENFLNREQSKKD